jgi:glucosamine-6-phosphate deaminase
VSRIRLEVFPDGEWADRVAAQWLAFMQAKPTARLCLPTGDTPRPVYEKAASRIDFGHSEVFLLDEFCLPAGDAARCDEVLQKDLLSRLSIAPGVVHKFDPQALDMHAECARFDHLVDGNLDLTILGLGGNGHLGLNEPGSKADYPTRVVKLARMTKSTAIERYGSSLEPECGLTLGMGPILASREIWLLVTGTHKAGILARAMNGPIGSNVPASFLRNHPNVVVFADESAARDLVVGG